MNKKSLLTMITLLMVAINASAVKLNDIITKDGITYLVSSVNDYSKEAIVTVRKPESGKYSGSITIPNRFLTSTDGVSWECQVTSVLDNAFAGSDITSITLPSNINDIQEGSFANCLKLTSVTLSNNVSIIWGKAFYNCTRLTSINIPSKLTKIGDEAFKYCYNLQGDIVLPSKFTTMGTAVFEYCEKIKSVDMSAATSFTEIPSNAFCNCTALTTVTLPSAVTKINPAAFMYCPNLNNITLPSTVKTIGIHAFSGSKALTQINNYATSTQSMSELRSGTKMEAGPFTDSGLLAVHVLKGYKNIYKKANGWRLYLILDDLTLEGVGQCATPEVTIENGKIKMSCATENATCHYTIDVNYLNYIALNNKERTIKLPTTLDIICWATHPTLNSSDYVTKTLNFEDVFPKGDVNDDKVIDISDVTKLVNMILGK